MAIISFAGRHVAIVAAHPDDETIGFGGQIPLCRQVTIIHVTDGAPRAPKDAGRAGFSDWQGYAAERRRELNAALALTGLPISGHFLGMADQQSSFFLAEGTARLAVLLAGIAPDLIVTHPYEGGHPDHDATAFMTHAAHRRLESPAPPLIEMTSYHRRNGAFTAGAFLPGPGVHETRRFLPRPLSDMKRRMFDCFATQAEVLKQFGVEEERFRQAPTYDFTALPTVETLHYEQFDWGMSGMRFCALAAEALRWIDRLDQAETCAGLPRRNSEGLA